jgi:hypothetical protein
VDEFSCLVEIFFPFCPLRVMQDCRTTKVNDLYFFCLDKLARGNDTCRAAELRAFCKVQLAQYTTQLNAIVAVFICEIQDGLKTPVGAAKRSK